MEMSCGIQSAAGPVFVQFNGDFVNESVWDLVGSCSSSEWMFRICLTSLLKGFFAEMKVVRWYAMFLHT